jgi:hypothetical protein
MPSRFSGAIGKSASYPLEMMVGKIGGEKIFFF